MEKPSSSAGTPIEEPITLPPLADQKDLAERMAVAERLARTISHDLNNVFQSLLVNLQFAENGAHGMPSVVSDIRDAQQTTERALALAKQLKLFTRSHSLSLMEIDLTRWLERHREHLSRRVGHVLAIGVRPSPLRCIAKADGVALLEIVERLVDNALDAMPEGGTVLLSTAHVEIPEDYRREHPYHPPEKMVMMEVRDTGPGMEPEVARHAFEPYYSQRRDSRDAGYGLAFVHAAVRKMGGMAEIISSPGNGTSVRLFFQAGSESGIEDDRPESTEEEVEVEGIPPTRGILIVESDPIVREVAARCLAREGYPTFEATDGDAAIEIYQRNADAIALVVLEFALPKRSGLEVQAAIRAISPQQRFLFSSSFNSDLRIDAIAEDPKIQLIPKPFTRADLLNTVELMIGRP